MFDVYMQEQSVDPALRSRLIVSALAAMAVTTGAIALSWTMNQMSIGQVSAPKVAQQLMLTLSAEPPPPPAPPPRPHAAAASDAPTSNSRATAQRKDPAAEVPDEDALPTTDGNASAPVGGGGGGVPGPTGPAGPGVGCLGPLCSNVPFVAGPAGIPRPPKAEEATVLEPFAHVKARSLFTPDPDVTALAKTTTGMMSKRGGRVTVSFCVGPAGKVESAKVTKRFGQDAAVDNLCRKAVLQWRFKPAMIGGKTRTTCSEVTFDLQFDR